MRSFLLSHAVGGLAPVSSMFSRYGSGLGNFIGVILTVFGLTAGFSRAEESTVDFETLPPDLPGWSATVSDGSSQGGYRVAAKWDKPMVFALESDKPHGGAVCLRCEVTEEIPGTLNIASSVLAGMGAVEIRFFVRTEGLNGEGMFSMDELDPGNKRLGGKWAAAKIPLSEDWTEIVWAESLGPETSGIRLRFAFKSIPAGAKVWIDDISVKSVGN